MNKREWWAGVALVLGVLAVVALEAHAESYFPAPIPVRLCTVSVIYAGEEVRVQALETHCQPQDAVRALLVATLLLLRL